MSNPDTNLNTPTADSEQDRLSLDPLIILPTPPSTPAPEPEGSDSESDKSYSSLITEKLPNTPPFRPISPGQQIENLTADPPSQSTSTSQQAIVKMPDDNTLVIGTVGQRQAAAINNILAKIIVKKPLDGNSWNTWSDGINLGLAGAEFDGYLKSDAVPAGEDAALHIIIQKCLVTWLIANMNQTESDRAISFLTVFDDKGEKSISYKPADMWKKMKEYHASQSTQKRMILRDALDAI